MTATIADAGARLMLADNLYMYVRSWLKPAVLGQRLREIRLLAG